MDGVDFLVLQADGQKCSLEIVEHRADRFSQRHLEEAQVRLPVETGGVHEALELLAAESKAKIGEEHVA